MAWGGLPCSRSAGGDPDVLPPPATEAVWQVATSVQDIRSDDVDRWEAEGLDRLAYVELMGVTARVRAVDTFLAGVGAAVRPLPEPRPGPPSGATVAAARRTSASAVSALVPARVRNSRRRLSWLCFSASVERASSISWWR